MKKTKSPAEKVSPVQTQALGLSAEERAARNQQLAGAGTRIEEAAQPLRRYTSFDEAGMNPLRRSLTQAKTAATTQAGNQAVATSRLRALQAGLQNQPLQYGNEMALENERARALANIPSEVEQEAGARELQAAGMLQPLAAQQIGIAGQYSPESYFGTGAGMESQRQGALNEQYLDAQRRKAAMWQSLIGAGTTIATGGLGGSGGLLGRFGGGGGGGGGNI